MHIPKIKLKFLRKLLPKRRRDRNMDGESRNASPGGIHNRGVPTRSVQAMLVEAEPAGPATIVEGQRQYRDQHQDQHRDLHHQGPFPRRTAKNSLRASSQPKGNEPPPSPASSAGNEDNNDDYNDEYDDRHEDIITIGAVVDAESFQKAKKLKQPRRHALPPPPKPVPEDCPICHDPVGVRNPEGICEGWTKLHCGHKFGTNCLRIWFQATLEKAERGMPHAMPNCPICRTIARPVTPFLIYPPPLRCHRS